MITTNGGLSILVSFLGKFPTKMSDPWWLHGFTPWRIPGSIPAAMDLW